MNPCQNCSRRKFLGGLVSAGAAAGGLFPITLRADEVPPPDLNRTLPLRLADYQALNLEGGSLMLTFDGEQTVLYVIRGTGSAVYVMSPTCPHEGCRVDKYDKIAKQTSCPCHGSTFDIDGSRLGGPTPQGLAVYPSQVSDGVLQVEVPEFEFGISRIAPVSAPEGSARLAVTFSTKNLAAYRLERAPDPAGPFLPASFSLTTDGEADQSELPGDGDVRTVYVPAAGPRGFFRLKLMLFEIG